MMKRKLLAAAITAGLASTAANAVNVNSDGLGQVLLYPYYTVNGGNNTLLTVVNTTEQVKAVKVRFLEGKNSREVLDFNLYLSPFDVWTGVLLRTEDGAQLRTADTSCTVPAIPADGVAFRNFEYTGTRADGEDTSLARTREGHVEIIEMGVVTNEVSPSTFTPATWATHTSAGVPANCPSLVAAWGSGGAWTLSPSRAILDAEGGLFGGGILVNVAGGTDVSYNATSLDGFFLGESFHTAPGDLAPSLNDANPQSLVFFEGDVVESDWDRGVDAVSAVLMHNTLLNEYVVEAATAAGTDWVVTFPTKNFYVQRRVVTSGGVTTVLDAIPPFTEVFGGQGATPVAGGACEDVGLKTWDREEQTAVGEVDFSPLPPGGRNVLCWETNVITFDNTNVLGSENLLNNINPGFESGWMRLSFTNVENVLESVEGDLYQGLPTIGFAVQHYVNGALEVDGATVLSNYANLFDHRATRSIIDAVQ